MNISNVLSYGGQVTLIGIVFVFIALGALILSISFTSRIVRTFFERKRAPMAPAPAPAAAPAAPPEPAVEAGIDPAVVAAIAAAVAAFSDSGKQLVIRSVRRSNNWARAARSERMSRF